MFINLNWSSIGIAAPASVDDVVAVAVRHGFGGVDMPACAYATDAAADHARAAVEAAGLRWGLFALPGAFLDSDDATFEGEMARLREIAPRVARAGGRATYQHVWPASDTLDYAANVAHHVGRLRRMTDVLRPPGIRVGLEFIGGLPLRQGRRHAFVHTLPQALELADAAGPGVGVVIDAYHWWAGGGTTADVRALPDVHRVVNVHLSDGVAGVPRDAQQDLVRAMPGSTGLVAVAGLLSVLRDRGYDGPVICEPFDPTRTRLSRLPADAVAAEVMATMRPLVFPAA